ncbi:(p)ppGpp synthetase I SpoT/RelA [Alkalispirillum mobile]|uniref:GTP pyrophosphokinase n=1 Tax=Alkalispirillum mobile TaxID=85925 RepID=A0A498BYB4_9GAMM|nr:GTP diphosphokinase [Alkalispirillum mobile]RLK48834.1 (p)ppGpp synthetase I SpoT/RelA [Alkalispirillum mobile]
MVHTGLTQLPDETQLDFDSWVAQLPAWLDEDDREVLSEAWRLAEMGCKSAQRPTGDSYFEHGVAVATILSGLRLDAATLAAGLLHDLPTLDETALGRIRKRLGSDVAHLVEGASRMQDISRFHAPEQLAEASDRAEGLRKMLLAIASDVRVVFITLAERLHDLRTLRELPEALQRRIAQETRDIYAPLANRLGIWQLKWELEDLAFRYLQPDVYKQVARLLAERRLDREAYIERVRQSLHDALRESGIKADVVGRPKHIYSIWRKMQRKGLRFEELYDLRALRVLVDDVGTCYAVLGVVHSLWKHIPKEFDDYIATPKENNYRSLHTAVIGPEGKTLEVQIRTHAMHQEAELGIAAHWRYKEGGQQDRDFEQKIAWLRQILEWGQEENGAEDFLDRFKAEVFEDRVYVITPQGDVVDLPRGATPLDFAYHIHSHVGHHCRGAKVNGRMVPLTHTLKSGSQVEIITSRSATPSRDWLNPSLGYLRTSRARAKARTWFRQQDHDKNVQAGRNILDRELHRLGLQDVPLDDVAQKTRFRKLEDFLAALGRGDITAGQIASIVGERVLPRPEGEDPLPVSRKRSTVSSQGGDEVTIYGVDNLLTRLARCCTPAPGDPIIGFLTRGRGVTIHRRDCPEVGRLRTDEPERLIDVTWTDPGGRRYPVNVVVHTPDLQRALQDVSKVLTNEQIRLLGINTQTDARGEHASLDLSLEVADVNQMSRLMNRIGSLPHVQDVHRKG